MDLIKLELQMCFWTILLSVICALKLYNYILWTLKILKLWIKLFGKIYLLLFTPKKLT